MSDLISKNFFDLFQESVSDVQKISLNLYINLYKKIHKIKKSYKKILLLNILDSIIFLNKIAFNDFNLPEFPQISIIKNLELFKKIEKQENCENYYFFYLKSFFSNIKKNFRYYPILSSV